MATNDLVGPRTSSLRRRPRQLSLRDNQIFTVRHLSFEKRTLSITRDGEETEQEYPPSKYDEIMCRVIGDFLITLASKRRLLDSPQPRTVWTMFHGHQEKKEPGSTRHIFSFRGPGLVTKNGSYFLPSLPEKNQEMEFKSGPNGGSRYTYQMEYLRSVERATHWMLWSGMNEFPKEWEQKIRVQFEYDPHFPAYRKTIYHEDDNQLPPPPPTPRSPLPPPSYLNDGRCARCRGKAYNNSIYLSRDVPPESAYDTAARKKAETDYDDRLAVLKLRAPATCYACNQKL